jgi:hypothetical protein
MRKFSPNVNSLLSRAHLNTYQRRQIDKTFAPFFREHVLEQLPMDEIASLYCADNGRPTKDLRAVTGAIILQQMFNLTDLAACVTTPSTLFGRKP